jgi:hypothetical protein
MAADVTETITEILPHIGLKLIYFTGTKANADDTITFGDFTQVLYCAAVTGTVGSAGADDPVTDIDTNKVYFSVGTGTIRGFAIVA